jgi:hypothetical protein
MRNLSRVCLSPPLGSSPDPSNMSHKQFVCAHQSAHLAYLIRMPNALSILLAYRTRDTRVQSLLLNSIWTFLALLGVGLCGFHIAPMFLVVGVFAYAICLCAWILWLAAGDILLEFALEDARFFELAIGCRALSVFTEMELSLSQSEN